MCDLCHMPECKPNFENGLHYPHRDHSDLYANLFPGQCGGTVIWGFYGVQRHNFTAKVEEMRKLEEEARERHHSLLLATAFTGKITDDLFTECEWTKVHTFTSKYGSRNLDLWVKNV